LMRFVFAMSGISHIPVLSGSWNTWPRWVDTSLESKVGERSGVGLEAGRDARRHRVRLIAAEGYRSPGRCACSGASEGAAVPHWWGMRAGRSFSLSCLQMARLALWCARYPGVNTNDNPQSLKTCKAPHE
jgi:hypothetical protein